MKNIDGSSSGSSNDGISSLARNALKSIDGDSQSSKSGSDGISSLARRALKDIDSNPQSSKTSKDDDLEGLATKALSKITANKGKVNPELKTLAREALKEMDGGKT